jgi:two-component system LytT family sensor kinase
MKLEEQRRRLVQARLDALTSQINPHFLFNTLNSVASLVRFDPDTARLLIVKLSNILRRLLKKHENYVPLREELAFIDDYLDIEVVRFGPEKLRVEKVVDPQVLDAMVPSMLLQPIVENSIRHGLSPKIDGGRIIVRGRREGDRVLIDIEDDGVGIAPERRDDPTHQGIGMANVRERLRVLYGDMASFEVSSEIGEGTCIHIEIPDLHAAEASSSRLI